MNDACVPNVPSKGGAAHGLGLITRILEQAAQSGLLVQVPAPMLAQLVLGAVTEAALTIAHPSAYPAASVSIPLAPPRPSPFCGAKSGIASETRDLAGDSLTAVRMSE